MKTTKIKSPTDSGSPPVPIQEMEVPAGGIIMYTGSDTPAGFEKVEGLHFVMASSSTGVSKTATSNELTDHTHLVPATATEGAHVHYTTGTTDSAPTTNYYYHGQGITFAAASHYHSVSAQNTSSSGGHSHASFTSSLAGDVQPPYVILNFIKNTSGALAIAPIGSIVMIGAGVAVPSGWAICDGSNNTVDMRERFAYGTASNAYLLTPGGSATHTHPAKNCPSAGEHTHTYSPTINEGGGSVGIDSTDEQGVGMSRTPHAHTVSTFTTASQPAHAHLYPVTSAASHLPYYIYLYYIQRIT